MVAWVLVEGRLMPDRLCLLSCAAIGFFKEPGHSEPLVLPPCLVSVPSGLVLKWLKQTWQRTNDCLLGPSAITNIKMWIYKKGNDSEMKKKNAPDTPVI